MNRKIRFLLIFLFVFLFALPGLFEGAVRAEGEEYTLAGTLKKGENRLKLTKSCGQEAWKFVPTKSGAYRFASSSKESLDPDAHLYREDWEYITYDDNSGENGHFILEADLIKDQVYYIVIDGRYLPEEFELTLTVSLEKEFKTLKEGDTSGCELTMEDAGFVFTPSLSKTYVIYTTGSEDTRLSSFRKANGDSVEYSYQDDKDTYNHDRNLYIWHVKLEAGEMYLLKARLHPQNTNTQATVGFHIEVPIRRIDNTRYSTITLKKDKYKWTGKKIQPTVKIIYDGEKLVKGTDYTVSYRNNKNAGTGEVIITGIGYYEGEATRTFTIKGLKLTKKNTKITLSKKKYKYNGKAKKPKATVKYKGKKLKKGKNYKVIYKNNVEPGKATVVIQGTGQYLGTVKKTFTIKGRMRFTWGRDNWNFTNGDLDAFMYAEDGTRAHYRDQISEEYLEKLADHLTPSEYERMFNTSRTFWLDTPWIGSCYGMSATTYLAREGVIPFSKFTRGAKNLNQLVRPVDSMKVSSLITYYHLLQVKDGVQQQFRTVPENSHKTNIKKIEDELSKHTTVVVGYKLSKDGGGHTVLVYDKEKGHWEFEGYTFNRRFKLCDPNSADEMDESDFIYYNTSTYEWISPQLFWDLGSMYGSYFNFISGDMSAINDGGFLSGSSSTGEGYVAQLTDYRAAKNLSLTKAKKEGNQYLAALTGASDIKEGSGFYNTEKAQEGYKNYNLFDGTSAYQAAQPAGPLNLSMDYENFLLGAEADNAEQAVFDPIGYTSINGPRGAYKLSLTVNEGSPTTWFTVHVSGTASKASLQMTEEGYVLTADSLEDVTVSVNNKTVTAETSFSTGAKSVLIYEIDEETIGIEEM